MLRQGAARQVRRRWERLGMVRQARLGSACSGGERPGVDWHSTAGKAALGKARQAWHDMASTGGAGLGRLGESEIGVAWQGR